MTDTVPKTAPRTAPKTAPGKDALRVADLSQNTPTTFEIRPAPTRLRALADQLGLSGLRKLCLSGTITAQGRRDWVLKARLGATVTQACVVTLDPVTTRIDLDVRRTYLASWSAPDEEEVEMSADETIEKLGTHIDVHAVMVEALVLVLPLYPRKPGTGPGDAMFTRPGQKPMSDEDARPFAGLSDLHESLKKDS